MPIIAAAELLAAVTGIFRSCGAPVDVAEIVAEHLVDADACGVTSHGVIRVPQYLQAVEEGRVVPDARPRIVAETVATARVDGGGCFGQVAARRGMEIAIERATQTGVGVVTVVHCGHTGRLGAYTEQATRGGMAGMMMINSGGNGQWVAPFGGAVGRLSTNPISIAVPTDSADPLMLDIATSVAPEGKVRAMQAAGRAIPEGWVIDHQGNPTTNPADLYGPPRGALLPFGGHKGFGLSMLIDALAGGLSGAGCCSDPTVPMAGKSDGVLLIAINVEAFCSRSEFAQMIGGLIAHVKSTSAPGVGEVLVPGEMEAKTRRARQRDGIPIEPTVWEMVKVAERRCK